MCPRNITPFLIIIFNQTCLIVSDRALRYKLFFVKALTKRLRKLTIITITITEFSLVSLVIDYNETIITERRALVSDQKIDQ